MTHQPSRIPEPVALTPAAVQAAVALVSAAALDPAPATVEELLVGVDPLAVATILSIALSSSLRATLGVDGRTSVLEHLGLDAARRLP